MSALQPYKALYFFAADNTDEVNAENKAAYDDGGFLKSDNLAELVSVVACEVDRGSEYVWVIGAGLEPGRLRRIDSWMVRKYE